MHLENGHACRRDLEAQHVIERHSEVVRYRATQEVAVTYDRDPALRSLRRAALQESDDAGLRLQHELAPRNARYRTLGVEARPARVPIEILKSLSGPLAEIDLLELLGDFDFSSGVLTQRF